MTDQYSISDLAEEFGVSGRTIRFYEEKGLLSPLRSSGNQRIFRGRDRVRLKLILRGKELGLKLDEMSEILGLTEEHDEVGQMNRALEVGLRHRARIRERIGELEALERQMAEYGRRILARLEELGELRPEQAALVAGAAERKGH